MGTYEDQALSFCGDGGFWVFKHSEVQVQGRVGLGCSVQEKERTMCGYSFIISFDQVGTDKNQALGFCGDGVFLLVKGPIVQIQYRFLGTSCTEGPAVTHQFVVGRPFSNGHEIEVGALASGMLTEVKPLVLSCFPSFAMGTGSTVRYDTLDEVADVCS